MPAIFPSLRSWQPLATLLRRGALPAVMAQTACSLAAAYRAVAGMLRSSGIVLMWLCILPDTAQLQHYKSAYQNTLKEEPQPAQQSGGSAVVKTG
jgi:hypothetical protein